MLLNNTCLMLKQLLLLTALLLTSANAASKILVYSPTLSRSHMISNGRVADALAKDGHNVTLLEVDFIVLPHELNASKLARRLQVSGGYMHKFAAGMLKTIAEMSFREPIALLTFFGHTDFHIVLNQACEDFILAEPALLAQLKAERFDMIFSEQLNLCGAGLAHLLDIPTYIQLSSCPIQEHMASIIGLPNPSSYVPSVFESNLPDTLTMWGRFQNAMLHALGHWLYTGYGIIPLTQMFRQHFGPEFPDLRDIVKQSPFLFVSVDELVDFPRPVFPNTVYIGGLGIGEEQQQQSGDKKQRALPEPFKSEMAKGARGVIFFSMGSIMSSTDMDERFKRNVLKAFSQLPDYHFIVKMEKEDNFSTNLAKQYDNVFLTPWAPQTQLLNHPRLKLFISHGGYNSLMETARAGVPLIAMGFFADQYRNARVAERNGWALSFEKRLLLEESDQFRATIQRMLEEKSFHDSAKRTQKLVLNKPFSAEGRLTKSIRFLELSGGRLPELLSESRNMSAVALYNLDLLFLGTLVALCFMAVSALLAMWVWRRIGKRAMEMGWEAALTLLFAADHDEEKKQKGE